MTDKTKENKDKFVDESAEENTEIRDVLDDSTSDTETADITEDEAEGMQEKIAELTAEVEKEKKEYLFLRAEFDNFRKRMLRDREELVKNASEKTLKGLLPIVDDFERGLDATKDAGNAQDVRQGMELIYNKLLKYLADNGVTPIESTGKDFDPDLHEAIATIPAPSEDLKGKVVDTTTKGYMLNDKVLRHAKVAVGE